MRREPGYDVAQICLNGHVINSFYVEYPVHNRNFCSACGQPTIIACEVCKALIRGSYSAPGVIFAGSFDAPSFCSDCGNPYPWTTNKIEAAKELAAQTNLSIEEQEVLAEDLNDIVRDTPRTTAAAQRFKGMLAKVGGEAAEALKTIAIDVAAEAAKKILLP